MREQRRLLKPSTMVSSPNWNHYEFKIIMPIHDHSHAAYPIGYEVFYTPSCEQYCPDFIRIVFIEHEELPAQTNDGTDESNGSNRFEQQQ